MTTLPRTRTGRRTALLLLRIQAAAALALFTLGTAACQGSRLVLPARPEPESIASVDTWREAAERWDAALGYLPMPEPPEVTAKDAPYPGISGPTDPLSGFLL